MIQRIQSLFLLILAICMGAFVAFPIWQKVKADGSQSLELNAFSLTNQINTVQSEVTPLYYLGGVALLAGAIALFAIFQYRNRLLQSALCAVNSILLTVLMGLVLYHSMFTAAKLFDPEERGEFLYGFYALVIGLVANAFANRFIRRDEKLVKESNRFR